MKKFSLFSARIFLILFLCIGIFSACRDRSAPDALDRDTSYAFGMILASYMKGQMGLEGLSFNYDAFMQGFRDFNEAQETRFTMDQAFELITVVLMRLQAEMDERAVLQGEVNREEGEAFLAQNAARPEVSTTPSGLQFEIITQGSGPRPNEDSLVRVHYEGTFLDGTVFDSSLRRGQPIDLFLDQVIPAWTEGLQLMNEGSRFFLYVPYHLAYGPHGVPGIPPFSTLIFYVELISILEL